MGKGGFCIKVIGFPTNLIPKPAPTSDWLDCVDWVFGFAIGFAGARDAIALMFPNNNSLLVIGESHKLSTKPAPTNVTFITPNGIGQHENSSPG
jgi:hypothetical protein